MQSSSAGQHRSDCAWSPPVWRRSTRRRSASHVAPGDGPLQPWKCHVCTTWSNRAAPIWAARRVDTARYSAGNRRRLCQTRGLARRRRRL